MIKRSDIPNELQKHLMYYEDTGWGILSILETHLDKALVSPEEYKVPVPPRYILEKGYRIVNGHVVTDAPYDSVFGLEVDEAYRTHHLY